MQTDQQEKRAKAVFKQRKTRALAARTSGRGRNR